MLIFETLGYISKHKKQAASPWEKRLFPVVQVR